LYNTIKVLNFYIDNPDRINFYFVRNELEASLCNQLYRTEHTVKCVDGVVTEESAINVHIRVTFVIFVLDSFKYSYNKKVQPQYLKDKVIVIVSNCAKNFFLGFHNPKM